MELRYQFFKKIVLIMARAQVSFGKVGSNEDVDLDVWDHVATHWKIFSPPVCLGAVELFLLHFIIFHMFQFILKLP